MQMNNRDNQLEMDRESLIDNQQTDLMIENNQSLTLTDIQGADITDIEPSTLNQSGMDTRIPTRLDNDLVIIPADDDNTPLAHLFPNTYIIRSATGEESFAVGDIPPEYSIGDEILPPYSPKRVSDVGLFNALHVLCELYLSLDLFLNSAILFFTTMMFLTWGKPTTGLFVPASYVTLSVLGKLAFSYKHPKWMLFFSGTYFARWAGDLAVAIYVFITQMTKYYDMPPFIMIITLPVIGLRGFYMDLFPCYNTSLLQIDEIAQCPTFEEFGTPWKPLFPLFALVVRILIILSF
ncbi:hypothetical protein HDV02_001674 [Globomyces sp. JEL0801]|nr:hypothetical protein HDV02_001674 [Globomyces sp. JEL0801]